MDGLLEQAAQSLNQVLASLAELEATREPSAGDTTSLGDQPLDPAELELMLKQLAGYLKEDDVGAVQAMANLRAQIGVH